MNIQELSKILQNAKIERNEADVEAKMLFEHFCHLSTVDIFMGKKPQIKDWEIALEKTHERAKTHRPIQHIIGFANFMGENFIVNEKVLIPRDETEILVRKAVEIANKYNFKMALDIGTGSGCIACMLSKLSSCQVIGLDISMDAIMVALNNATRLNLNNHAIFRKSDIFSNVKEGEKFDIIVSNPPYIPPSEKENIQIEVKFDPQIALFTTDKKGLEFYEKIISQSKNILKKGGYILFELGIGQSSDVKEILCKNEFSDIEIIQDLAKIDRVILAKY